MSTKRSKEIFEEVKRRLLKNCEDDLAVVDKDPDKGYASYLKRRIEVIKKCKSFNDLQEAEELSGNALDDL